VRVGHILLADGADDVAEEGLDDGVCLGDGASERGDVSARDVEVEFARANHLREAGEDADAYVHVVSVASD
jgi:hypothetical protein